MSEITNQDVNCALDSLSSTAMRVKEERDSLLAAAKLMYSLIETTALVFDAKQIQWLQATPSYKRLCDAIDRAEGLCNPLS
jgi:hypothetical protein